MTAYLQEPPRIVCQITDTPHSNIDGFRGISANGATTAAVSTANVPSTKTLGDTRTACQCLILNDHNRGECPVTLGSQYSALLLRVLHGCHNADDRTTLVGHTKQTESFEGNIHSENEGPFFHKYFPP